MGLLLQSNSDSSVWVILYCSQTAQIAHLHNILIWEKNKFLFLGFLTFKMLLGQIFLTN
jgi:hypothetical protein